MTDREQVLSWLEWLTFDDWRDYHSDSEVQNIAKEAFELLREQEAVVRCKDCRYGQYCTDRETTYQCFKWNSGEFGVLHEQDWFCADGKRKDGD